MASALFRSGRRPLRQPQQRVGERGRHHRVGEVLRHRLHRRRPRPANSSSASTRRLTMRAVAPGLRPPPARGRGHLLRVTGSSRLPRASFSTEQPPPGAQRTVQPAHGPHQQHGDHRGEGGRDHGTRAARQHARRAVRHAQRNASHDLDESPHPCYGMDGAAARKSQVPEQCRREHPPARRQPACSIVAL